jgi:hypothetical protein
LLELPTADHQVDSLGTVFYVIIKSIPTVLPRMKRAVPAVHSRNPARCKNFLTAGSSKLQNTSAEREDDMRTVLTVVMAVLLQSVCVFAAEPADTTDRWDGVVKDRPLQKAAPTNGIITKSASWKSVWQAWRPNQEVPQVDFETEIVVVGVVPGPNRVLLKPVLAEGGDLQFVVAGTRMAGPGFGYALEKVSREGVKTVNGKPISSLIKVQGTLSTGIMASGGETTGMILTTEGGTWELDFRDNKKLRELADKWNGKTLVVTGVPERREGVEIKERHIIKVESHWPVGHGPMTAVRCPE